MQLQSFIYCKNFKSNPNDDALQPQSSLAEYSGFVWGAEQNLLLIAENIIQIIFLILSLSEWTRLVKACACLHLSNTHLTRNMACRNLWPMQARANERSIILP